MKLLSGEGLGVDEAPGADFAQVAALRQRLTDPEWTNLVAQGQLPPRPEWTKEFVAPTRSVQK